MDSFSYQSNTLNYQSACPWGIYSLRAADEMLTQPTASMEKEESLDAIHLPIARLTKNLRAVHRELTWTPMHAPHHPSLLTPPTPPPETHPTPPLHTPST